MNVRFTLLTIIACLLLAAPVALIAQDPPPGPPEHFGMGMGHMQDPAAFAQHRVNFMTQLLSLTDEQQKQATAIFTDSANAASKLQTQLKTAHDNLQAAIKSKNAAAVDQNAALIGNLTAQLVANHAKSDIAFAKTLTEEQQVKLDKFESDRGLKHEGGGPRHQHGAPHGPDAPDAPPAPPAPGGLF